MQHKVHQHLKFDKLYYGSIFQIFREIVVVKELIIRRAGYARLDRCAGFCLYLLKGAALGYATDKTTRNKMLHVHPRT